MIVSAIAITASLNASNLPRPMVAAPRRRGLVPPAREIESLPAPYRGGLAGAQRRIEPHRQRACDRGIGERRVGAAAGPYRIGHRAVLADSHVELDEAATRPRGDAQAS